MKKRSVFALVILLSLLQLVGVASAKVIVTKEIPMIRVGLVRSESSALIGSEGTMEVIDDETGKVLTTLKGVKSWKVEANGLKSEIAGKSAKVLRLQNTKKDEFIEVNGKRYRGNIEIIAKNSKITVINIVSLEDYLYGVLPGEMSPSWPLESLKAQAVAARSYGMATKGKHSKEGFDVCTTTDCQVYGGVDAEQKSTNRAVDQTRGEVLTYDGKVITAFFHSASGGYTENSEFVWSSAIPYLRGVEDYDQKSPHYSWKKEVDPAWLSTKLASQGDKVGEIQSISLSEMKKSPQKTVDRGISGRVLTFEVIGSTGKATISGNTFRTMLGLKSTCFDLYVQEKGGRSPVQVEKAKKNWGTRKDTTLVIEGYGWGHGLGLSQWGAKAMAENDPSNTGYQKILLHYYTGVKLENLYD